MPTFTLPEGFSYALAAAVSTQVLTIWQSALVGQGRKKAKVPYPQLYAEKAEVEASREALVFNCVQRAHQNTLELLPNVLAGIFITGLTLPRVSAGLGAAWVLGRILYTLGYRTGDPKKRNRGFIGSVATLGLLLSSVYSIYGLSTLGL